MTCSLGRLVKMVLKITETLPSTEVDLGCRTHDGVNFSRQELGSVDGSGGAVQNWRGTVYGTRSVAPGAQNVEAVNWESGELVAHGEASQTRAAS